jgi:hypothetical protein
MHKKRGCLFRQPLLRRSKKDLVFLYVDGLFAPFIFSDIK